MASSSQRDLARAGPRRPRRAFLLGAAGGVAVLGFARAGRAAAFLDEAVLGAAEAPVTIIEYASMTCPHCAEFHRSAMPALKEEYLKTGKARLVYRDFPLDQLALQAAMVARCGGPERYFAFVDVIYGQQQRWARASDPIGALKQLVAIGGLPAAEIDACLADKALEETVLRSRLAGQNEHQVSSTPTFVVNGEKHVGLDDPDEWRRVLDPMLAAGG
jgi:protein-disulfide isomerase